MAATKKESKTEYGAMVGFSVGGKSHEVGKPCPDFDADTTRKLVGMKRIAPVDSEEFQALCKRIEERIARAEKDRKANEAKGKLPGAK